MATIYISYQEIANLIKDSGKLPKQITKITPETNGLRLEAKIIFKLSATIFIESCKFPILRIKISGIVSKITLPLVHLFFPEKIPPGINISDSILEINIPILLKEYGFSADFISLENIENQAKLEIRNFKKI
jgi:hypothetical protein